MKKLLVITIFILIVFFLSSFFKNKIDEKIEQEFEDLDCVKIAWIFQESGKWNAWLICEKGRKNFQIHESAFFKSQLKNKVIANLEQRSCH